MLKGRNMPEERSAHRCTVLIDDDLYFSLKSKANLARLKLYQYLNNLIALDLNRKPLYYPKEDRKRSRGSQHPTTKQDKQ